MNIRAFPRKVVGLLLQSFARLNGTDTARDGQKDFRDNP
jgi:hypothetical protein